MLEILKQQLSAEWNKPKAKNAKEGQEPRNEERIAELQAKINQAKAEINAEPNDADLGVTNDPNLLAENAQIVEEPSEEIGESIL